LASNGEDAGLSLLSGVARTWLYDGSTRGGEGGGDGEVKSLKEVRVEQHGV